MSVTESTKRQNASLTRDILSTGRYYLGNRRALLILAVLIVVAGLALNWSWLVAIGVAPVLLSTLPCLLMCAFGVCMMCKANKEHASAPRDTADAASSLSTGFGGITRAAPGTASCCNAEPGDAQVIELKKPQPSEQRSDVHA